MKTSFNASVNLSLSNQANSSDAGALLVREVLENSQVMNFLTDHLTDSRDPVRIVQVCSSNSPLSCCWSMRYLGHACGDVLLLILH